MRGLLVVLRRLLQNRKVGPSEYNKNLQIVSTTSNDNNYVHNIHTAVHKHGKKKARTSNYLRSEEREEHNNTKINR